MPVGDFTLKQLFDQAHVPISPEILKFFTIAHSGEIVTLHLTDAPFYAAFLEICRQAKLEPQLNSGKELMGIVPRRARRHDPPRPSWIDALHPTAGLFR